MACYISLNMLCNMSRYRLATVGLDVGFVCSVLGLAILDMDVIRIFCFRAGPCLELGWQQWVWALIQNNHKLHKIGVEKHKDPD